MASHIVDSVAFAIPQEYESRRAGTTLMPYGTGAFNYT